MMGVARDRPVQIPFISNVNLLWKEFCYPQTLTFALIIPHSSPYDVCHCLIVGSAYIARSNATSSNATLSLLSGNFAFRILLCVWISMFIQEKTIAAKQNKINKNWMQQRPTANSRQSAASQRQVSDVISKCIMGKTIDFQSSY